MNLQNKISKFAKSEKAEYDQAYDNYVEARDSFWKVRDKLIKQQKAAALAEKIRKTSSLISSIDESLDSITQATKKSER